MKLYIMVFFISLNILNAMGIKVWATAFTSSEVPNYKWKCTGAWGDDICSLHRKKINVLAVTRDIERKYKLKRGSKVLINGKTWIVLDRVNKRLRNRVDLFFGEDQKSARKWGKRKVRMEVLNERANLPKRRKW